MNRILDVLAWTQESSRHAATAVAVSLAGSALGIAMMLGPAYVRSHVFEGADNRLSYVENIRDGALESRLNTVAPWFKADYTANQWTELEESRQDLTNLEAELAGARKSWNTDLAIEHARSVQIKADDELAEVEAALSTLNDNQDARTQARESLEKTHAQVESASDKQKKVRADLVEEGKFHPAKYSRNALQKLSLQELPLREAQGHIVVATRLLPANEDVSGTGDPQGALGHTKQAEELVGGVTDANDEVTQVLAQLKTARTEAAPTRTEADAATVEARSYIDQIGGNRDYSADKALAEAYRILAGADQSYRLADATLLAEKPIDFVVAYDSGKQSLDLATAARSETDAIASADDESNRLLGLAGHEAREVEGLIRSADTALQTLSSFHNQSAWGQFGTVRTDVRALLSTAQLQIISVESLRSDQRYKDALREVQSARNNLSDAQSRVLAIVAHAQTLEANRAEWPTAESQASGAIASNSGTVTSYSSYSGRAVAELSSAQSHLSTARSRASDNVWEEAVDLARQAASEAEVAGSWAVADYNAEIQRQREEEERRQRRQREAAEAARRALEESSRSYSPSYGGGCCDSSPSYDGGGGYGGGSYGGGFSDSGAGGGGFSDSGAFPY